MNGDNEFLPITVEVMPGLIVRPGDVLIVQSTGPVTVEQATRMRNGIKERLPDLADVLFINNATVGGVYRTECDEIDTLRALVENFIDPDDCDFDHHGYCQAHMWFEVEPRCPHARAKELLA